MSDVKTLFLEKLNELDVPYNGISIKIGEVAEFWLKPHATIHEIEKSFQRGISFEKILKDEEGIYFSDGIFIIKNPPKKLPVSKKAKPQIITKENFEGHLLSKTEPAEKQFYLILTPLFEGISFEPLNIKGEYAIFKVDNLLFRYNNIHLNIIQSCYPEVNYGICVEKYGISLLIASVNKEPIGVIAPMGYKGIEITNMKEIEIRILGVKDLVLQKQINTMINKAILRIFQDKKRLLQILKSESYE